VLLSAELRVIFKWSDSDGDGCGETQTAHAQAHRLKQSLPDGKLPDGFGDRAPDLAIEIVSPSEDMPDLLRKVGEYFESGAQEVWLLFPETQRVVRYTAPFETTVLHADDELTTPLAPDFRVRVRDLFGVE
jgi:Uma2 family endonuclease